MKVRFTARGVRVRIDDLELARLAGGEVLSLLVSWPTGGWAVRLDPALAEVRGVGGTLDIGLLGQLPLLLEADREGVTLPGPPPVAVEKDFGPQHG